jgi:hypothetical protein
MRRTLVSFALSALLVAPASAQIVGPVPTIDVTQSAHANTQILKQIQEIQQQLQLVTAAQTELRSLPASFQGANIQGALSNVMGLLQTAQQECVLAQSANPNSSVAWQASENAAKQSWLSGSGAATFAPAAPPTQTTAPAQQCQISAAAANLQAAQLGTSANEIQSIKNAGAGSSGSLQALQAAVAGITKIAVQNDQATQRAVAAAQQKQVDDARMNAATTQPGTYNPWATNP